MANPSLIAAYAHVPIIGGTLASIIIWFITKEKDELAHFQAKQAVVWQIIMSAVVAFVNVALIILLIIISIVLPQFGSLILIGGGVVVFLANFLVIAYFAGYSILGAYKSYKGESFLYPIIGKLFK